MIPKIQQALLLGISHFQAGIELEAFRKFLNILTFTLKFPIPVLFPCSHDTPHSRSAVILGFF